MIDKAFMQATAPGRYICLGLDLRPFTVGHMFLLRECGSAYISSDSADVSDLVLSVFVCSEPHEKARRNVGAWWFPMFLMFWKLFCSRYDLEAEFTKFHSYLIESNAVPEVWTPQGGDGHECGSPIEWRLASMLMADFGMTWAQALDTPVARANCLWAAQGDRTGRLKLTSNRMRQFWEFCRQRDLEKFGGVS